MTVNGDTNVPCHLSSQEVAFKDVKDFLNYFSTVVL